MGIAELKIIVLALHLSHNPTVADFTEYNALPASSRDLVQAIISGEISLPANIEKMINNGDPDSLLILASTLPTYESSR